MVLPAIVVNKVYNVTPSEDNVGVPGWSLNNNDLFTTKSCYRLTDNNARTNKDVSWIWNIQCPNKIKFFLYGSILTKEYPVELIFTILA